jgi:outer membrane protein TolC
MCALLLFAAAAVYCQDVVRLTPDDAVERAITNNLSLESSRVALDTKQRKADLVWNQFLPTVSVSGTLIRDNEAGASSGMAPVDLSRLVPGIPPNTIYGVAPYAIALPQWHVNGTVSASLDFSFALIEGIRSIQLDYATGQVTLQKAKAQMERDVRKTYNQLLLLQETADLQNESLKTAEQRWETAQANYRAGLVPRLTVLQAQVAMENMKPTINELENNLKALLGSFAMSLGLPLDTRFELSPIAEGAFAIPLDVAELISKASSGKPDILELQRQIASLNSARKAQALQLYTPFLRFSWSMSSTFIQDPWKDSWSDADNWSKGGNFSITLGMSLNSLFPFTKEGQGLKDVDNNVRSLAIGLAQAVRGTELEVFTKVISLDNTRTTAEALRLTVEMAGESYRLTEEAYRAGLQDFFEVENAALSLSQARLQLLTQQFNYLSDLIDLEYAIGVPFGTLSSQGVL